MIESRIGPLDVDTAVRGYLRCSRSLRTDDEDAAWDPEDPDTAAYDAVEKAIRQAPAQTAWEVVRTLLKQAEDDDLGTQAAGPLEDLVRLRAAELIDEIEAEVERDARFRWALGCVWLSHGELPADVLERVVRASGGEIKPLPPLEELERRHSLDEPSAQDHRHAPASAPSPTMRAAAASHGLPSGKVPPLVEAVGLTQS